MSVRFLLRLRSLPSQSYFHPPACWKRYSIFIIIPPDVRSLSASASFLASAQSYFHPPACWKRYSIFIIIPPDVRSLSASASFLASHKATSIPQLAGKDTQSLLLFPPMSVRFLLRLRSLPRTKLLPSPSLLEKILNLFQQAVHQQF